ncbi:hypothetical protein ABT56_08330 [Photobacterium aquae]|uniref:Uncharacterized protein n=1 Tax=Photobacterium aquae TaxID=1195763 RepID=A0A0J1H4B0_9GAMM|nr:OmpA family protein [Photobacterium aquae]KLV06618.1 hypothetical protein ABT56_08330 [Photobacterium aquae]
MYIQAVLACFLLLYSVASQATLVKWHNSLEDSTWTFTGSATECTLSQPVQGFGTLSFNLQAGKPLSFQLSSNRVKQDTYFIALHVMPPAWENFAPFELEGVGSAIVSGITSKMVINNAAPMFEQLMQGHWLNVAISVASGAANIEVSNVRFTRASDEFLACQNRLLPMGFSQVRDNTFFLSPYSTKLSELDLMRLDGIARYIEAKGNIKKVLVDGYMNSNARNSIKLRQSKEIADELASLLIERGVSPKLISVRVHGGRYPKEKGQPADKGRIRVRVVQQ